MQVKVTMKSNWQNMTANELNRGLLGLVTDIHKRSIVLAPKLSRALVNSGKVSPIVDGYKVSYGSSKVPYARRRHFENNKNPQTKYYLSKASENAMRGDIGKHFRGKI